MAIGNLREALVVRNDLFLDRQVYILIEIHKVAHILGEVNQFLMHGLIRLNL